MTALTKKEHDECLGWIQAQWHAAIDVRKEGKVWEVAILNTLGGKHWISITTAPAVAERALSRYLERKKALKRAS